MCELGLRAGAAGTKRLVGRNELRRGLKALSTALTEAPPAEPSPGGGGSGGNGSGDGGGGENGRPEGEKEGEGAEEADAPKVQAGRGRRARGWSEPEVDDLLGGLNILGSEAGGGGGDGGRGGSEAELTDVEFRERLMVAIQDGGARVDRDMAAAKEILPLAEKLEVIDDEPRLGRCGACVCRLKAGEGARRYTGGRQLVRFSILSARKERETRSQMLVFDGLGCGSTSLVCSSRPVE